MTILTSEISRMELAPDGILRVHYHPGAHDTQATAARHLVMTRELAAGTPRPLLVDFRGVTKMDREARTQYAASGPPQGLCAVAILIDSPLSRVIGNFFVGFNRSAVPVRLFSDEREAVDWLKEHRQ